MKQIIGNISCSDAHSARLHRSEQSQLPNALTLSASPFIVSHIASHPTKPSETPSDNAPPHSSDMADLIGKPPGFWNHPGTPAVPWMWWLVQEHICSPLAVKVFPPNAKPHC
ncbi:hypothetical protein MTO96_008140 [Rhipicephalus appendiculatus]